MSTPVTAHTAGERQCWFFRWVVNLLRAESDFAISLSESCFLSWQTNREETGTLLAFSNCYKNIFRVAVKKIQHITILSYEKLLLRVQLWLLIFTLKVYGTLSVPNKFHGCVAHWKVPVCFFNFRVETRSFFEVCGVLICKNHSFKCAEMWSTCTGPWLREDIRYFFFV